MGYVGSEEFIRLQFEEYLLSLISSVKCLNYMVHHANNPRAMMPQVDGDPSNDFGVDWIDAWSHSENYRIWDRYTESHLFDIVEPKHPCAGGLTIEDVQRRMMEQVKEFHLDERFAVGKEVLGRNLAAGKEKASTVFNKLYADMEALRESQRQKHEEAKRNGTQYPSSPVDLNGARQTVQSVGSKAGAYIGSWGTWMGEKRKTGWGRSTSATQTQRKEKENIVLPVRQVRAEKLPPVVTHGSMRKSDESRPKTQESYEESLFDAGAGHPAPSIRKKEEPRHGIPSKFHESIDDEESPKAVLAVDTTVSKREKVSTEEERSSAVAEAVETPISP
jgi:hypothetical protein